MILRLAVLIQYRRVTHTHTHAHTDRHVDTDTKTTNTRASRASLAPRVKTASTAENTHNPVKRLTL